MKDKLKSIASGDLFIVPESDYGKAEIWRMHDVYVVFEIPMYGGEPTYLRTYHHMDLDEMIEAIRDMI